VYSVGVRVQGMEMRAGFKVQGGVQGSGFRVQGLTIRAAWAHGIWRGGTSDELVEGEEEPDVLADDRVAVVMLRLEKRPKHAPAPIARLSL